MDLGKKFRKNTSEEPTDLDAEMEEIKAKYEKQMAELKEKQKKQQVELAKQKEQEEQERKEREEQEKLEQERKLIEEQKEREEHLKRETEQIKELEKQQQIKAKKTAELNKLKEELKDHPDGCRCPSCVNMRDKESLLKGKPVAVKEVGTQETKNIESGFLPEKKSKFSGLGKLNKPLFKKDKKNKETTSTKGFKFNIGNKIKSIKNKSDIEIDNSKINANVNPNKFTDITVLGLRLAIGISFIMHGLSKMEQDGAMFSNMLTNWGMPPELAFPIALCELIAGILLSVGFLTRIASAFIGVIMLGAIFHVKGAMALIGSNGVELDLIILAAVALIGMFGPGRLSVANKSIKGLIFVRFLH